MNSPFFSIMKQWLDFCCYTFLIHFNFSLLPLQADERFEVEVRARQAILMIQEAELERTQHDLAAREEELCKVRQERSDAYDQVKAKEEEVEALRRELQQEKDKVRQERSDAYDQVKAKEEEVEAMRRELQQEKDKVIRCVVLSMNKENDYLKMRSATYLGLNQYFHAGICIYAEFVVVFSKFIEFLV